MADLENPVTPLEEDTCWGYLAATSVGRLATAAGNVPEIFPINYVVDGQSLVFRSAEGSKLSQISSNDHVAFEIDGWDDDGGWSVLVKGTAAQVTDPDELRMCDKMPLRPWVPTIKTIYVRIEPSQLSGRAFAFGPEPKQA